VPTNDSATRLVALIAVIVLTPLAVICGAIAGLFLLNEFVNGLVPSRWLSDNGADWLFGTGAQGSARNYLGFMVSAVPASLCWTGARWGLDRIRGPKP